MRGRQVFLLYKYSRDARLTSQQILAFDIQNQFVLPHSHTIISSSDQFMQHMQSGYNRFVLFKKISSIRGARRLDRRRHCHLCNHNFYHKWVWIDQLVMRALMTQSFILTASQCSFIFIFIYATPTSMYEYPLLFVLSPLLQHSTIIANCLRQKRNTLRGLSRAWRWKLNWRNSIQDCDFLNVVDVNFYWG